VVRSLSAAAYSAASTSRRASVRLATTDWAATLAPTSNGNLPDTSVELEGIRVMSSVVRGRTEAKGRSPHAMTSASQNFAQSSAAVWTFVPASSLRRAGSTSVARCTARCGIAVSARYPTLRQERAPFAMTASRAMTGRTACAGCARYRGRRARSARLLEKYCCTFLNNFFATSCPATIVVSLNLRVSSNLGMPDTSEGAAHATSKIARSLPASEPGGALTPPPRASSGSSATR